MIRFEKVSFEQYLEARRSTDKTIFDDDIEDVKQEYDNIKLPKRSTSGSAGYDFFAPFDFTIFAKANTTIPTGIRWVTDRDDVVLICCPRSGLGFKFGTRLRNTIGVIDSDYCASDNEGHIMLKITAEVDKPISAGMAIMQGIILPYIKTDDDTSTENRNGGFGSTDKNTNTKKHMILNEEVVYNER